MHDTTREHAAPAPIVDTPIAGSTYTYEHDHADVRAAVLGEADGPWFATLRDEAEAQNAGIDRGEVTRSNDYLRDRMAGEVEAIPAVVADRLAGRWSEPGRDTAAARAALGALADSLGAKPFIEGMERDGHRDPRAVRSWRTHPRKMAQPKEVASEAEVSALIEAAMGAAALNKDGDAVEAPAEATEAAEATCVDKNGKAEGECAPEPKAALAQFADELGAGPFMEGMRPPTPGIAPAPKAPSVPAPPVPTVPSVAAVPVVASVPVSAPVVAAPGVSGGGAAVDQELVGAFMELHCDGKRLTDLAAVHEMGPDDPGVDLMGLVRTALPAQALAVLDAGGAGAAQVDPVLQVLAPLPKGQAEFWAEIGNTWRETAVSLWELPAAESTDFAEFAELRGNLALAQTLKATVTELENAFAWAGRAVKVGLLVVGGAVSAGTLGAAALPSATVLASWATFEALVNTGLSSLGTCVDAWILSTNASLAVIATLESNRALASDAMVRHSAWAELAEKHTGAAVSGEVDLLLSSTMRGLATGDDSTNASSILKGTGLEGGELASMMDAAWDRELSSEGFGGQHLSGRLSERSAARMSQFGMRSALKDKGPAPAVQPLPVFGAAVEPLAGARRDTATRLEALAALLQGAPDPLWTESREASARWLNADNYASNVADSAGVIVLLRAVASGLEAREAALALRGRGTEELIGVLNGAGAAALEQALENTALVQRYAGAVMEQSVATADLRAMLDANRQRAARLEALASALGAVDVAPLVGVAPAGALALPASVAALLRRAAQGLRSSEIAPAEARLAGSEDTLASLEAAEREAATRRATFARVPGRLMEEVRRLQIADDALASQVVPEPSTLLEAAAHVERLRTDWINRRTAFLAAVNAEAPVEIASWIAKYGEAVTQHYQPSIPEEEVAAALAMAHDAIAAAEDEERRAELVEARDRVAAFGGRSGLRTVQRFWTESDALASLVSERTLGSRR